ncbi:hypothetical protein [Streptomyces sp. NPDC101150]|uniref:hypothetical protein n=1 Tax=Streptomyces sp. NPDC101150 TaxID=3366114 RepID=UPI0037F3F4D0
MRPSVIVALAVLATGCTAGTDDTSSPDVTHPVTAKASAPPPTHTTPPPSAPAEEPEPSPSLTQRGRTRILHYGDVEVEATPQADGVLTTVTARNTTSHRAGYEVAVSIGDGKDWVASFTFRLDAIAPGAAKSGTDTVGGPHLGPVPSAPKIYIDHVNTY